MKTQIGYKVVRTVNSRLYSAYMGGEYNESEARKLGLLLEYKPFIRSIPKVKGTRLFAFLDRQEAIKYARYNRSYRVFKARLFNPVVNGWLHSLLGIDNFSWNTMSLPELIEWFKNLKDHNSNPDFKSCCVCTSITILDEVESV